MDLNLHKMKFGNEADAYTKFRKPYETELHDLFFSLMSKDNTKILDLACGTGKSTEPLVRVGTEVFGCDHDPLMLMEAKKQAGLKGLPITYSEGEAEHLPFEDNMFDAVTVGTAFHFFINDESIAEIKRVLKDNGLFFVYWTLTTKDRPTENSVPGEFFRSFNWDKIPPILRDLDNVSSYFNKQGFQDVKTARITFTHNDTIEEQIGLMKTASSYEILSPSEKERFIKELTEILTKNLGSRPYFTFEEEIQICWGLKA